MADKPKNQTPADGLGGIVDELASSRLVGEALTMVVDAGEKAIRAQQTALSALGLPSASQFENLTLRLRTIFHRLEELEDEIDRLGDRVSALEADRQSKPAPRAKNPRAEKPRAR